MLLIITGKTASGKDTVIKTLLTKFPDFKKIITSTSRQPRVNEADGIDYHFLSESQFREKIDNGKFLEYVEYGGNFYGTERSQINPTDNLIWKIDPSMAGKAKEFFPASKVIYINTSNEVVLDRLKKRGMNDENIQKRMADDQIFWDQFKDKYDFIVENTPGKLNETVSQVYQIIKAQKISQ